MAKYKNIKSVAHNIGYSFLSDMNMLRSGRAFVLVPEEIYWVAKAANEPRVRIDLITGEVEPSAIATPNVTESAGNYARRLPELLARQSVEPQMVRSAFLELEFDFANPGVSRNEPSLELPNVRCKVVFDDDRVSLTKHTLRIGAVNSPARDVSATKHCRHLDRCIPPQR